MKGLCGLPQVLVPPSEKLPSLKVRKPKPNWAGVLGSVPRPEIRYLLGRISSRSPELAVVYCFAWTHTGEEMRGAIDVSNL